MIAATKRGSTVLEEFSYDLWGRRRDANNWNNYEVTEPTLFTRGFTGHEHIGGYGLINMNGRVYDPRLGRFLSPDPYIQSPFSQSFNRYSYVVNNPLKYIDPDGYRRQPRTRANPDELPPPQNNIGGGFINNNPNSPGYYPPIGGAFSSISGNIGDPFSIGWGSWVNSFGKYTYYQSLNLRFWNSLTSQILNYGNEYIVTPIRALGRITFVGSFGPLGKMRIFSNGAISFENPTSGVHLSVADVVSSRVATNGGGPNYAEQSFSQSGFQGSWTSAEGVGAAGGFFYKMHGKVLQNSKGQWYVYASSSAWAPAAEKQADAITYYSSISVLENGKPIDTYTGNLQVWDPNVARIGQANFTYIGDGYMPLPATGNNISVNISITYNMYKWWNGHAVPQTPYVYTIKF